MNLDVLGKNMDLKEHESQYQITKGVPIWKREDTHFLNNKLKTKRRKQGSMVRNQREAKLS